jgi:hypothetical protein
VIGFESAPRTRCYRLVSGDPDDPPAQKAGSLTWLWKLLSALGHDGLTFQTFDPKPE